MALADCTEEDRRIIGEALTAAVEGPFFPEWEFHTLFGLTRAEVAEVARTWPTVDDAEPIVGHAVSNALLQLWGYPHKVVGREWDCFLSVPRSRLSTVLDRWQLRPPLQTQRCPVCGLGLDFDPWWRGLPSHEICPCCGVQFGYDDMASDATIRASRHLQLRRKWIDRAMPWWSKSRPPPPNWDPVEQLERLRGRRSAAFMSSGADREARLPLG